MPRARLSHAGLRHFGDRDDSSTKHLWSLGQFLSAFVLRQKRQPACSESEEENCCGNKANRNTPLKNTWRIGFRSVLRHWSLKVHRQENHIDAVKDDSERREESSDK